MLVNGFFLASFAESLVFLFAMSIALALFQVWGSRIDDKLQALIFGLAFGILGSFSHQISLSGSSELNLDWAPAFVALVASTSGWISPALAGLLVALHTLIIGDLADASVWLPLATATVAGIVWTRLVPDREKRRAWWQFLVVGLLLGLADRGWTSNGNDLFIALAAWIPAILAMGLALHLPTKFMTRHLGLDIDHERLRFLAEHGSEWLWETDQNNEISFVMGAPDDPADIMGRTLEEIAVTRDLLETEKWNEFRKTFEKRKPLHGFVFEVIGPINQWVSLNGEPEYDSKGNFFGYRGTARNVTLQVQGAKKLRDSFERFELFVERSPSAVLIQQDRVVRFLNPSAIDLFDLNGPDEAIGQSMSSLIQNDMKDVYQRRYEQAISGKNVPFLEYEIHTAAGNKKFVESSLYRTEWDGEAALISIYHDITDRKKYEHSLEESRQDMVGVLESLVDAVILLDQEGNIVNFNRAGTAMFGYPAEAVEGKGFEVLLPDDSPFQASGRVKRYLADELHNIIGKRIEVQAKHRDGHHFPMRLATSEHIGSVDDAKRYIVSCVDISREKQIEEALFQAQKMEAVGHLTGGIAHDFNNLLQVISAANSMLDVDGVDAETNASAIELIERSVTRGSSLTSQLLSYARQQTLNADVVSLKNVMEELGELLERTFSENIILNVVTPENLPQVRTDPHALHNAILNLCINAQLAMPDGGHLSINLTELEVSEDMSLNDEVIPAGIFVDIAVTDTGVGMTPDVLENAFNPFFSTRATGEGTGLGLSMVYGFARQSGGYCRIESEIGEGTTVHLTLPMHSKKLPSDR